MFKNAAVKESGDRDEAMLSGLEIYLFKISFATNIRIIKIHIFALFNGNISVIK